MSNIIRFLVDMNCLPVIGARLVELSANEIFYDAGWDPGTACAAEPFIFGET